MGVQAWGIGPGHAGVPGSRSVVVFASGSRALWEHLCAHPLPGPDPVDDLVRRVIASLPAHPDRTWVRCAGDEPLQLDFRSLAVSAGLGAVGRLGLVMHPDYGPWLGLRAACFSTEVLQQTPVVRTAPCEGCEAPCEAACPAGAVPPAGWQLTPCLAWQARETSCQGGCRAREACPVGREHAYGAAQHRYHHHPASRSEVLRHLGER